MNQNCNHCEKVTERQTDNCQYQLYKTEPVEKVNVLFREYRLCDDCCKILEEFADTFKKNNN